MDSLLHSNLSILPQLLLNALISGSTYALVSSGLSLTYGLLKILNFAHGHLMMLGAYVFYAASVLMGFSLLSSGLLVLGCCLLVSFFVLRIFIVPFTQYSFFLPLVTTLALSIILESVVAVAFDVNVKSLQQGSGISSYEFAGMYVTPIQILIIASALLLLSVLALLVHATPFGRELRALKEMPEAAQSLGIRRRRVEALVFALSVLLAAYAGILIGYDTNLQPTMGNAYTIKAFAAMILGGLGNLWGTVLGSYLLGLVENLSIGLDFGNYSLPAGYKDAFSYGIILLVLLVRPQGLFGRSSRRS
jgi:branched-chain amino acid transport system permease protein